MPPPNGSIGSITDGSTSTAETFRQQNWRTPTTVKPSPAIRSGAQKQSDRTRRGDSCCGVERGAVPLQPVHLADHLVPQIAQSPDQYHGLSCIAYTHHHHIGLPGSRREYPTSSVG